MQKQREIYERKVRHRPLYPMFVISTEGDTEEKSIREALKPFNIVVRFATQAPLGRPQVDLALQEATKQSEKASSQQTIIPVAICDIESLDPGTVRLAQDVVAYGESQGVLVCINVPHFERRMLLHFCPAPESLSKKQVEEMLRRELQKAGFPSYLKPGSDAFHRQIAALTQRSMENCGASGHSSMKLPCVCELFSLAQQHQSTGVA